MFIEFLILMNTASLLQRLVFDIPYKRNGSLDYRLLRNAIHSNRL